MATMKEDVTIAEVMGSNPDEAPKTFFLSFFLFLGALFDGHIFISFVFLQFWSSSFDGNTVVVGESTTFEHFNSTFECWKKLDQNVQGICCCWTHVAFVVVSSHYLLILNKQ